jgi:hypothetical protein
VWRPEHSGRTQSYPHERASAAEHLPSGLVLTAAMLSAVGLVAFLAWRLRRRKNDLSIYIEYPRQAVQRRYLRRVGGTAAFGMGAGLSAIGLQGSLSMHISATVLLMLGAGVLLLRLFARAARTLR